jgi:hypothetical protein
MPYYTSRAQDATQKIKEAENAQVRAKQAYSKGTGSLASVVKADRDLAAANYDLYIVNAGRVPGNY